MKASLEFPPGLVSDDTTFSTAGRTADANNMRPWRGSWQTIGGWSSAITGTLSGVCRNILPWTDNGGTLNIAFGTHSHLQVEVGGALYDITPAGLPVGAADGAAGPGFGAGPYGEGDFGEPATNFEARTWSLATYGQSLIASPRGGTIYQWSNDPLVLALGITNAPNKINSMLVTPERQVLAFGCNEELSGVYNPLCIRGSDIEDITDWTSLPSNNAFEHILEGGGRIVTARIFGSYIAVWTDNAVFLGQFIGAPGQAYRFDRVEENCGLLSPNAVTIINQTAYWIGPDLQFRTWAAGSSPQIVACPIRNDFKDNLDTAQAAKIVASSVSQYGEVWWDYPDSRDGNENSRYVAVSTLDGAWFRGQRERTAAVDATVLAYPLATTADGMVYFQENGKTANGAPLEWFIESSDRYLGQAEDHLMITCVWPDFEDQNGAVSLSFSLRDYPQSAKRTSGPYTLAQGQSKKDFRASGRVISAKITGATSPAFARLGKMQFDVSRIGRR